MYAFCIIGILVGYTIIFLHIITPTIENYCPHDTFFQEKMSEKTSFSMGFSL